MALGAEVAHPRADGVIGHAEALPDRLGGQALDKEGVQGREASVQGLRRFEEETAARAIVHEGLRGEGAFGEGGTAEGYG